MYTLAYRKPIMIFLTIVGLIMFIGSIFYFLGFNVPIDSPPYFQIVFGFFIIGILPFSIYRNGKKNFSSHGRLQEKIIYEFTDEKIKIVGETFNSELDWTKTYKIAELKDWILIYQNRQIANILPKESFGEKISDFRSLVKRKNVKAKLK
jgi:hypothetical protein